MMEGPGLEVRLMFVIGEYVFIRLTVQSTEVAEPRYQTGIQYGETLNPPPPRQKKSDMYTYNPIYPP